MRKFLELLAILMGIAAGLVAFLVLLYGDNWLGWHRTAEPASTTIPNIATKAPEVPEVSTLAVSSPRTDHPIVIKIVEPKADPIKPLAAAEVATLSSSDPFADVRKRIARMNVETRASIECSTDRRNLSGPLRSFDYEAIASLNQFYRTSNSSVMISDLRNWTSRVQAYLDENQKSIPGYAAFGVASFSGNPGAFHREGSRAWGIMDAKRKALEAIIDQIDAKPCDKIAKAAVTECEDNGNCQSAKP